MSELRSNLDKQVVGPTIELAAKVKAALEKEDLHVETDFGFFVIGRVELIYSDGVGPAERVGYLVPDEGEGKTFDFWTPEKFAIE